MGGVLLHGFADGEAMFGGVGFAPEVDQAAFVERAFGEGNDLGAAGAELEDGAGGLGGVVAQMLEGGRGHDGEAGGLFVEQAEQLGESVTGESGVGVEEGGDDLVAVL